MYSLYLGYVFCESKLDSFVLMSMSAGLLWTRDFEIERRPQTLYGMVWYGMAPEPNNLMIHGTALIIESGVTGVASIFYLVSQFSLFVF